MPTQPEIAFFTPSTSVKFNITREVFKEYAAQLGIDLCFQNFQAELQNLPEQYPAPQSSLILAAADGAVAGCCALTPLPIADHVDARK